MPASARRHRTPSAVAGSRRVEEQDRTPVDLALPNAIRRPANQQQDGFACDRGRQSTGVAAQARSPNHVDSGVVAGNRAISFRTERALAAGACRRIHFEPNCPEPAHHIFRLGALCLLEAVCQRGRRIERDMAAAKPEAIARCLLLGSLGIRAPPRLGSTRPPSDPRRRRPCSRFEPSAEPCSLASTAWRLR